VYLKGSIQLSTPPDDPEADPAKESRAEVLADQCTPHGDIARNKFFVVAGVPMVEIDMGEEEVIASEMMLDTRDKDPIAGRLLRNMIQYLCSQ
jgi:hypothetical protein